MTFTLQGVHLWNASLDECRADDYLALELLLDEAEISRARRFYFERDRRRFTVARGLLRVFLGRYLNVPPESVAFGYTQRGKPFLLLPETEFQFNLSHSGGKALFAFARSHKVGVDVEAGERLGDDWPSLARRYFSAREQAELNALPEHQRRAAFLTGWARKEAYLKATGLGIADGLQTIEVTLGPDRPAAFLSPEIAARWTLCEVGDTGSAPPLAAALVIERRGAMEEATPEIRRFSVVSVAALLVHQDG